jgi:hypothetical protein
MIRNLETGEERVAKVDTRDLEHPDWSRDGRFIVRHESPNGPIERIPADDATATPEVLAATPTVASTSPPTRPTAGSLVFGCDRKVCTMGPDGKVVVLVDAPGVELNHFAWGASRPGTRVIRRTGS